MPGTYFGSNVTMPYVQVADDETSSDANAPVDNGKPFAKASVSVATNRLDWGQVAGKTAAREEDDGLVEEDPLPPYLNPAGIYTSLLHQKRKREHASAPFVSLPPRTIGGLQDQILPTITCACKSSKCIRLYCDCFASSLLCTGKCTCADGCHNDGASEHTHTRTGTILGILNAQSLAFRPSPEQLELASAGAINEYMSKQTAPSRSCSCRKSRCLKVSTCTCVDYGTIREFVYGTKKLDSIGVESHLTRATYTHIFYFNFQGLLRMLECWYLLSRRQMQLQVDVFEPSRYRGARGLDG